jgi:DNA (cytosine-5)-methyltransferase 1
MRVVWQSEIDPYACAVLRKHWPDVPNLGDIHTVADFPLVDVLCGGFPCQPVSLAGKRKAQADDRWLWPEYARAIRLVRPHYVLVENVPGLLTAGLELVLGDLAQLGYDAEWDCIPAAAFGAPHLRYRVLLVAYPNRDFGRASGVGEVEAQSASQPEPSGESLAHATGLRRQPRRASDPAQVQRGRKPDRGSSSPSLAHANFAGPQGRNERQRGARQLFARASSWPDAGNWSIEPAVGRVAHGVPSRVDRLRALGNAVVPQVAEWAGRQIVNDWMRS